MPSAKRGGDARRFCGDAGVDATLPVAYSEVRDTTGAVPVPVAVAVLVLVGLPKDGTTVDAPCIERLFAPALAPTLAGVLLLGAADALAPPADAGKGSGRLVGDADPARVWLLAGTFVATRGSGAGACPASPGVWRCSCAIAFATAGDIAPVFKFAIPLPVGVGNVCERAGGTEGARPLALGASVPPVGWGSGRRTAAGVETEDAMGGGCPICASCAGVGWPCDPGRARTEVRDVSCCPPN